MIDIPEGSAFLPKTGAKILINCASCDNWHKTAEYCRVTPCKEHIDYKLIDISQAIVFLQDALMGKSNLRGSVELAIDILKGEDVL
jgi:hypothetical protein